MMELWASSAAHVIIVEVAQRMHAGIGAANLGDGLRKARGLFAD
jgi:hypothetical protein